MYSLEVSLDNRFMTFSTSNSGTPDIFVYLNVNKTNTERTIYNVTTTVVEGNSTPFQYTKEIAAIS